MSCCNADHTLCRGSGSLVPLLFVCFIALSARAESDVGPPLRSGTFSLTEADRRYWAFQPVERPALPKVQSQLEVSNPIDRFILAKLADNKLSMNPAATPRELVRRAYFDLVGLPPSPKAVREFEANPTDTAWIQLVDRLLASPHYGERWGRHWLDLVRYAESNGYERDGPKPNAWRYRDYVIQSFNADKPYHRFILEQLAGDELANELLARTGLPAPEWRELIIATGYYRLHVWDDEPDSTLAAEYDDLDDILVTTGTAFLGMTIGCARCHDHKYDPISQRDYYSMLSFIRSIDPYGLHKTGGGGRGTGKIERPLVSPEEVRKWQSEKQKRVSEIEQRLSQIADPETKKQLEAELKSAKETRAPFDFALCAVENGSKPVPTRLLARGDANSPLGEVSPAFPEVFGLPSPEFPEPAAGAPSTGRRRVLAEWIASPQNPLTARVMMNRLWQHHFGVGLVATPDDFGRTGLGPTHPALLDFLATDFMEGDWKLKRMHKLIMTSTAYRMSSRSGNPAAEQQDPNNSLFWRQNLRRAEAEVIRDSVLFVSGSLNTKQGGPSVFPSLPREVHVTQDSAGKGWSDSPEHEQNRRSVYLVVKRALKIPLLECFDFAQTALPSGTRPVTTTAPQALMLLNDVFMRNQASALAERIKREAIPDPSARIEHAFKLVLQRKPAETEIEAARTFLAKQRAQAEAETAAAPDETAWTSFCRAMLNLNEFIYVD